MNKILETTNFVIKHSKRVRINKEKIKEFCEHFSESHINHWLNESPFDFSILSEKDKISFLLVLDSISFSYWGNPKWSVKYKGEIFDGAWGMITSLGKAVENKVPILNMRYLSKINEKYFEKITQGNVKIPLFEERVEILKEIGTIVTEKFQGDFSNLIKKSENDAIKLLNLIITNFPSFEDSCLYLGKRIYFYKRAQLLVSDIHQMLDLKLKNINQLTACADYKLPKILRQLGILEYSEELENKIDNKIELPRGSEEEIEIRAGTIWANEFIKKELKKKIPKINTIHINDHLWLLGQTKSEKDKPYHLTRTTAY
jgi:hypothetical protein